MHAAVLSGSVRSAARPSRVATADAWPAGRPSVTVKTVAQPSGVPGFTVMLARRVSGSAYSAVRHLRGTSVDARCAGRPSVTASSVVRCSGGCPGSATHANGSPFRRTSGEPRRRVITTAGGPGNAPPRWLARCLRRCTRPFACPARASTAAKRQRLSITCARWPGVVGSTRATLCQRAETAISANATGYSPSGAGQIGSPTVSSTHRRSPPSTSG